MELTLNGKVLEGPLSEKLIEKTIRSLTGKGDSFAILSKSDMTYIQTSGCAASGYLLEYQEGSIEEHFSCTDESLSETQVIEAFQRYLAGDTRWKSDRNWAPEDLGSGPNRSVTWLLPGILALVVLFVVWRYANAA